MSINVNKWYNNNEKAICLYMKRLWARIPSPIWLNFAKLGRGHFSVAHIPSLSRRIGSQAHGM